MTTADLSPQEYERIKRIGAYQALENLGVEIRFKLDNSGVPAKTGDLVKQLLDGRALTYKAAHPDTGGD